jgi:predicted GNAT family N-acyltransferase
MTDAAGLRVRLADWNCDRDALRRIRHEVFVVEQRVPVDLEWDGVDADCRHALAEDASGAVIGCARLLPDGHLGRMAVRKAWRGRGAGAALLALLVEEARRAGHARVLLNAQTQALGFYARQGFAPFGDEFFEAGIAHRAMALELRRRSP